MYVSLHVSEVCGGSMSSSVGVGTYGITLFQNRMITTIYVCRVRQRNDRHGRLRTGPLPAATGQVADTLSRMYVTRRVSNIHHHDCF